MIIFKRLSTKPTRAIRFSNEFLLLNLKPVTSATKAAVWKPLRPSTEQKIQRQIEKVKVEISEKSKQYITQVGKAVETAISTIAAEGVAYFDDLQKEEVKEKLGEGYRRYQRKCNG